MCPTEYSGIFSRGSCTSSNLNLQTRPKLLEYGRYIQTEDFQKIRDTQSRRLKRLLNYKGKDAFDIIFAPSGSDLAYIPLIFSEILEPQKEKLVLLTCPEELGSGTQMGFLGKYFGQKNQFGEDVEKGEDINPKYNISLSRFPARNNHGLIINHYDAIHGEIDRHPDVAKIGSLVIGSKSGIEDDISMIPKMDKDVLWVVDLCQFRNSKKLVNQLLSLGCMVMITGSKFYQSPPFCGIMLIPKEMTKRVQEADVPFSAIQGYHNIFSYYDFPSEYQGIRKHFRKEENPGLTLRWEIAIDEMERFNNMPTSLVNDILYEWNHVVSEKIRSSVHFELMPQQEKTNSTIISFKVKEENGRYLEFDELKKYFKFTVLQKYQDLERFNKIFFGQPVKYGYGAFIRLALGANNIYNLAKRPASSRFNNDKTLVELLDRQVNVYLNK